MSHCHAACKIYLQPFFWEHIKWVQKRNRGSNSSPNPPLAQALSHHTLTQKGKNGFPTLIFFKEKSVLLIFLTFFGVTAPSKCGELLLQHHESMHKRNFQNKEKKTDFFAQSNYTNMSENSQEKNPKNQIWDTRVSNNSLFSPQTFK